MSGKNIVVTAGQKVSEKPSWKRSRQKATAWRSATKAAKRHRSSSPTACPRRELRVGVSGRCLRRGAGRGIYLVCKAKLGDIDVLVNNAGITRDKSLFIMPKKIGTT